MTTGSTGHMILRVLEGQNDGEMHAFIVKIAIICCLTDGKGGKSDTATFIDTHMHEPACIINAP